MVSVGNIDIDQCAPVFGIEDAGVLPVFAGSSANQSIRIHRL
jgi:hypothetical protein